MSKIDEFVRKLSDQERIEIIQDHISFEENGSIGDCLLRTVSGQFLEELGDSDAHIVLWMNELANACHRHYSMLYLGLHY